jgi:hypothetical protein
MHIMRWVTGLAAAGALFGCSENAQAPTAVANGSQAVSLPAALAGSSEFAGRGSIETTARVVALAMADSSVRLSVRDAMRASPLTEHKLSLRGFMASPAGRPLLIAAAQAASLSPATLLAGLARFPALDFYVPAREHRRTWTGTNDIAVGVNFDGAPSAAAYLVSGESVPIDFAHAVPARPVMMLQSAEFAARRIHQQSSSVGDRIQDADDGESGAVWVSIDAAGKRTETQLADIVDHRPGALLQTCFPTEANEYCGGTGGGGGGVPEQVTRVTTFSTSGVCDNGNCSEGNEFEFTTTTQFGGPAGFLRETGIGSSQVLHPNWGLISTTPFSSGTLTVAIVETDGTSNDDHWSVLYPQGGFGPIAVSLSDNGALWPLFESPCCVDPFVNSPGVFVVFGW